ncbi:hypothetical protein WHI96_26250 [Pseudonocardia tropica]|uniref:Uncharacterized protein n=1 Tax=Pseudonocardia tropica TaxID=681289 RepID=A0ABV1K258_9PSEU
MSTGSRLTAEGVVRSCGLTWFQYGTHLLTDDTGTVRYALCGDDPAVLDAVTDRKVRVSGQLVPGYPLDGGPFLVKVDVVTGA